MMADIPRASFHPKPRIAIIWLVPALTALLAGYLGWHALSRRGPSVEISFRSASGLAAGQTRVEHRSVVVGTVEEVTLSPDMTRVVVRVRMQKAAEPQVTVGARFWVVRPRLAADGISGLETLVSGSFIEMDPGSPGAKPQRSFVGLEEQPGTRPEEPGRIVMLATDTLDDVGQGSPVYYRGLLVGQVLSFERPSPGAPITLKAFVKAPYDAYVAAHTRFWSVSGLSVVLQGGAVRVQVQSLAAILSGGIAFGDPAQPQASTPAPADAVFRLYAGRDAAEAAVTVPGWLSFVSYLAGDASGLAVGAPVQVFGLRVGMVRDVSLVREPQSGRRQVRVAFEVDPGLLLLGSTSADPAARLAGEGLRAKLSSLSMLTGQQGIGLEFDPSSAAGEPRTEAGALVIPGALDGLGSIVSSASAVMDQLAALPFASLGAHADGALRAANELIGGNDAKRAVADLAGALASARELVVRTDTAVAPAMRRLPQVVTDLHLALARAEQLMQSLEEGYGNDSRFRDGFSHLLAQTEQTVRSVRELANQLNSQPQSLVFGRSR